MNVQVSDCVLELGTIAEAINDPFSMGVKQSLSFIANLKGREYQKGRFNITLAIIDQYQEPGHSPVFGGDLPIGEPIIADSMVH